MATILVVDDEPASVRTVQRTLADLGRVVTAGDATVALERLAAESVALVVSDQRMPDMVGTRLLELCAQHHPDVVRVLLTGYTDNDTLIEAINAGHVYYYLNKPWEARDLRLVVQRGLERHAAAVERRHLSAELEAAYARACREAEGKGRLLALAAHEIGTPVHVAANAVEIAGSCRTAAAAQPWIERATEALAWLGRVAEQLHRGGEWGTGTRRLRPSRFELGECVRAVANLYAPIAAARSLSFEPRVDAGDCWLEADRRSIEDAVGSLLSNAIRFTPDGGSIVLTAARCGDTVCVEVADTGMGIDAALLPDVFEAFSAAGGEVGLHSSGRFALGARGLGLGLATARAAVEAHGGRIEVDSEVGRGSRFRILLPVAGGA